MSTNQSVYTTTRTKVSTRSGSYVVHLLDPNGKKLPAREVGFLSVEVKPQEIGINSNYFSLLNSNKTHLSNTHQMIKM